MCTPGPAWCMHMLSLARLASKLLSPQPAMAVVAAFHACRQVMMLCPDCCILFSHVHHRSVAALWGLSDFGTSFVVVPACVVVQFG